MDTETRLEKLMQLTASGFAISARGFATLDDEIMLLKKQLATAPVVQVRVKNNRFAMIVVVACGVFYYQRMQRRIDELEWKLKWLKSDSHPDQTEPPADKTN